MTRVKSKAYAPRKMRDNNKLTQMTEARAPRNFHEAIEASRKADAALVKARAEIARLDALERRRLPND